MEPREGHSGSDGLDLWTGEEADDGAIDCLGGADDAPALEWLAVDGAPALEWLEATTDLDATSGTVDMEAEIWPALAAIIPAVVSAAPAIINAIRELAGGSKPAPRPPAPPSPIPAPVRPQAAPVPATSAPSNDAADVLRQLAALLPRLTALAASPGGRESLESSTHANGDGETSRAGSDAENDGAAADVEEAERGPPSDPANLEASANQPGGGDRTTEAATATPEQSVTRSSMNAMVTESPADLVPMPDLSAMNVGVSPCPTSLLVSRLGRPREILTADCQAITSQLWEDRMVFDSVGRFRVRGHRQAVGLFRDAFAALEVADPDLYARVGSSGMLCVRHVRGRPGVLSNHALGLALDVTIDGRVDIRGDNQVQRGFVTLHDVFGPFGIYWGAALRIEDAIHFEVGAEVVHRWLEEGTF